MSAQVLTGSSSRWQPSHPSPVFRWIVHAGSTGVLALAAATWGSSSIQAQQVVADGTTSDVAGPYSTVSDGAIVFHALNGGIIQNFPGFSVQVSSTGVGAHALLAETGGQILIGEGTTITTTGAGASAISVGSNSTIEVTGATISTSGSSGAYGVNVTGANSSVALNNSEMNVHGAATSAVVFSASGSFEADGSTITSDDGAAFEVTAGTLGATIANSTITGDSDFLNVSTGATLNMYAASSTLTGAATMASGAVAQLNLLGSSVWNITGDSNLTLLINQSGSVAQFTPPGSGGGPFKTLTVLDYVGVGGTLSINTHLGGDDSLSDRLIIDGGSGFGESFLAVTNVGGVGAVTQANGILVVDTINGGTTVPGMFTLAAPVTVGPYEYSLYRGSVDASNPDAWYLRSILDCTLDPTAPVCGAPDYRREASLYAAVPAMTMLYGRLMLDTLHERRGDSVGGDAASAPNAGWARVIGQHGDRDGSKVGIYGAGPAYDYDFWALQGGTDLYRDGGVGTSRNQAGAFFAIGQGSGDVQHIGEGKAGQNKFMAYSAGAYWTHFTPGNAYVDTLLMGSWYDVESRSTQSEKLTTDGGAFGASVEVGYPAYIGLAGFKIEPQAQLAFQTVHLSGSADSAAQVRFDNVNSLVGRVGVRFAQDFGTPSWLTGEPSTFTAWVQPNFWYEFLGDPKTELSSPTGFVPFAAKMGGTTFEINTGFSSDVGDGTTIYANASYLVGIGEHADGNAFDGKLGIKIAW